jgi:hypothetical protein
MEACDEREWEERGKAWGKGFRVLKQRCTREWSSFKV